MIDHSTALLGLPGFEVLAAEKTANEWHVVVQLPRDLVGCALCGAVAVVKDRRTVTVRDLPTPSAHPAVELGVPDSATETVDCRPTHRQDGCVRQPTRGLAVAGTVVSATVVGLSRARP